MYFVYALCVLVLAIASESMHCSPLSENAVKHFYRIYF